MEKEILEKINNARKNLIIEGDVGSGKTTNISFSIVDELIKKNESLFILDNKEEYINEYYQTLKENNYNTIIINLRDMSKSEGWNPLEYPYYLYKNNKSDKAIEYIEKITKNIFHEDTTMDPFWTINASDLITGIILGLFEDAKKEEINFNSVYSMMNQIQLNKDSTDNVTTYFKSKNSNSKSYIFASSTILAPSETKGGIVSFARQKLRLLIAKEKLSQLLNKTTFNINEITSKKTAIIIIGRDENRTLNILIPMLIEQLYSILIENKIDNKFNFIIDNFDDLDKNNDLITMLSSCIYRDIKFHIVTRSLEKIIKDYSDYINTLCDFIKTKENHLITKINDSEIIYENVFESLNIKKIEIEYPKLKEEKIVIFDLNNIVNTCMIEDSKYDGKTIDELKKNVDKRIK